MDATDTAFYHKLRERRDNAERYLDLDPRIVDASVERMIYAHLNAAIARLIPQGAHHSITSHIQGASPFIVGLLTP